MGECMKLAGAALLAGLAAGAQAQQCAGTSPAHTVALVELYTSEGCSSCPPADNWLRSLGTGLGERLAPIAWHVDYWDFIGWKDPFAKAGYSARQRELTRVQRRSVVYTPQVMVSGRDFRRWSSTKDFAAELARANAEPARAAIRIALQVDGGGRAQARAEAAVAAPRDRPDALLFLALYENGLANRVTAGENHGATLRHDFVAREWSGPVALDAGGAARASVAAKSFGAPSNMGALAFVQNGKSGAVLQAMTLACPNR